MTLRIGSLFSCVGGLDLAALSVVGGSVAWHAEIDPAGCKVLTARWPGVPNLGSVSDIDFTAVEPVDLLAFGFPCTDVSLAGAGAGIAPGTRSGLWSEGARAIKALRPSLVLIENVRGLLSARANSDVEPCPWCLGDRGGDGQQPVLRALGAVLGDLADLGFDAEWIGVPASDVGACHQRFRVFVLAWPARPSGIGCGPARWDNGVRAAGLVPGVDVVGDASLLRRDLAPVAGERGESTRAPGGSGGTATHSDGAGRERKAADDGACGPPSGSPASVDGAGGCGSVAAPDSIGEGLGARCGLPGPGGQAPVGDGAPTLAHPDGGAGGQQPVGEPGSGGPPVAGLGHPTVPDAESVGRHEGRPEPARLVGGPDAAVSGDAPVQWGRWPALAPDTPSGGGQDIAGGGVADAFVSEPRAGGGDRSGDHAPRVHDAGGDAPELAWGVYEPAIRRWELVLGRAAPPPTTTGVRGGQQLSAEFVEWMQGLPAGWVTDEVSRNDALRLLGGMVVPQQGAAAFRTLLARRAESIERAA